MTLYLPQFCFHLNPISEYTAIAVPQLCSWAPFQKLWKFRQIILEVDVLRMAFLGFKSLLTVIPSYILSSVIVVTVYLGSSVNCRIYCSL